MQLSEAWEAYQADKRIEGFSPHTLKAYRLQANLLIRHIRYKQIHNMTTQELKDYRAVSSVNLKPASLAHRIRFIDHFFAGCMKKITWKGILLLK